MRTIAHLAFVAAIALAAGAAVAVQPRTSMQGPAELSSGDASGVAVTSRGRLFLAPKLTPSGKPLAAGEPAYVWSAAANEAGDVVVGTGPDGRVLRLTAAGDKSVFFTTKEPMVTAVAVLPGGDVLAGTSPDGKIYRIGRDGVGRVWCETKARYVWALVVGANGTVYAGTGEQGIIYKIDGTGRAEPFFDSEEPHVVSLATTPDGTLIAGGAGRGLVYRIDAEGHALVVHDDDLPEVKAVAVERDGGVVAALLAQPELERRPPAVRIQVAGGAEVGSAPESMADLEDRQGRVLQGVIEGLPDGGEEAAKRLRGRVVRIAKDGTVSELWRSSSEAPYALALDDDGRPLFGTGEPARIYRVEADDEIALLATLPEGQVTSLVRSARSVTVGTSNPASTYRLDREVPDSGVYLAPPMDAGGLARWATIRWRASGSGRSEVYTRTGNSADPDETWSAWSPALTDAGGSPVVNPEGRFLQWRVRMIGGSGSASDRISGATVSFLLKNRAPALRDLRLESGNGVYASKVPLRWSSFDPDGDPLSLEVQYRRPGSSSWATGARVDPPSPKPGDSLADPESAWKDGKASWDVASAEEGVYELRVSASDQPYNAAGDGKSAGLELASLVTVDRTPPIAEVRGGAGGAVEIIVSDAISGVVRVEVTVDGKPVLSVPATVSALPGKAETVRIPADSLRRSGAVAVRTVDAAGNAAESPLPTP